MANVPMFAQWYVSQNGSVIEPAMRCVVFETKLGWMGVIGSQHGIRRVVLPETSPNEALDAVGACPEDASFNDYSAFGGLPERLRRYLEGEDVSFTDRLDLARASDFSVSVWQAARSIPYGETRSYQWVAERVGKRGAARAVGQAMARNPFAIIVPCHRVVGSRGLGGFGYGLELKKTLLEIEARGSRRSAP